MIFHSLDYLVFLFWLLVFYWSFPRPVQNGILLVASLFFYGYGAPKYLVLLLGCGITAWASALVIERNPERKSVALTFAVFFCFGTLAYYKYANFFLENLKAVGLFTSQPTLHLILPVGISFFTFQAASYVFDVYRGELKARQKLQDVLLFKAFFPQLVAGPIERGPNLFPQIENSRTLDFERFSSAILLVAWGFFKKLVIADNVATVANKIFALEDPTWPGLWAGVFAFAIQIYTDFSGYTDIARGSARLLGFELMKNFNHPYLAQSPQDFWRRWHISLSSWFRDYLYISLGGSRRGELLTARNVLVTFTLCGFWHGASWNFIFWGIYHAILLICTRIVQIIVPERIRTAPYLAPVRILFTFVLVCIGWLIFRETNNEYLMRYLLLDPTAATKNDWRMGLFLSLTVVFFSIPLILQVLTERVWQKISYKMNDWATLLTRSVCTGLLLFAILHFSSTVSSDFIYFQF